MGRLANKHILITGGNSGIGLAAAQEFDREGARVAICGLNERTLKAAKETLGAGSLAVRADVSNLADLDAMFTTIKREFGHLDGIFVNAGHSEFLPFEEVTEQSFDQVIAVQFQRGLLHNSKGVAAPEARLICHHQCVRYCAKGMADDLDRLALQGRSRQSRSHPQLRTRGPRDSREHPQPRPDGHGDVRSFPRRRAGRCGQGGSADKQSEQAAGRSVGNREAGSVPRVGRFCVRRRGRLLDRRRGHGHFGRWRLSLVAVSGGAERRPGTAARVQARSGRGGGSEKGRLCLLRARGALRRARPGRRPPQDPRAGHRRVPVSRRAPA